MDRMIAIAGIALACPLLTSAQAPAPAGVPAQIIITVGHLYGQQPPALTRDDMTISQRYDPLPITNLIPLRGDRAALDIFLLVDHCSDCEVGSKFAELKRFIASQPSSIRVGVAYIKDGRLRIAENPTADHQRAIEALSVPAGSKPSTPFTGLAELIQSWPSGPSRRAVLMFSNGVDPSASEGVVDPSAETAIQAAQRARVAVFTIYHPSADYLASDFSKLYGGQILLAHIAEETGGEGYFLTFGPSRPSLPSSPTSPLTWGTNTCWNFSPPPSKEPARSRM